MSNRSMRCICHWWSRGSVLGGMCIGIWNAKRYRHIRKGGWGKLRKSNLAAQSHGTRNARARLVETGREAKGGIDADKERKVNDLMGRPRDGLVRERCDKQAEWHGWNDRRVHWTGNRPKDRGRRGRTNQEWGKGRRGRRVANVSWRNGASVQQSVADGRVVET